MPKRAKTDSAPAARRRGINPYGRKGHPLKHQHELLASASDEVVAEQTGLTVAVVAAYRKKHRIALAAPKAAAPTAKAAPKAAAPTAAAPKAAAPAPRKAKAPAAAPVVAPVAAAAVAPVAAPVAAPAPVQVEPAMDEVTVVTPVPAAPAAARWVWVVVAENGEGATRFAVVAEDLGGAAAAARAGLAGRDGGPWTLVRAKRTVPALG